MEAISMDSILSIRDLSIHIGERSLMDGISFEVSEGEAVLLSGANGIGKSTLLKSILRLETDGKKIAGKITVRWTNGSSAIYIKDIYLSDDGSTPSAIAKQ